MNSEDLSGHVELQHVVERDYYSSRTVFTIFPF